MYLGNLDSKRDWGHAKDYVAMQWLMLQQDVPQDYVIASGRMETVRKFIEISARILNWNKGNDGSSIIWEGEGIDEIGRRADTGDIVIRIDPRYFRPTEVDELLGDISKARTELGWSPKTSLEDMVEEMINFDLNEAKKELILKKSGIKIESDFESPPSY